MRIRDRIVLAWRGYWAEISEEFRQGWEGTREEYREFRATLNETRHWDLIIRRKITGLESPTRKDVRRAVRQYRKEEGQ